MKKNSMILTVLLLVSALLTGCGCKHEWQDATCDAPQTCAKCGETQGEALGHIWVEATCAEAKHCQTCGATEGEALPHSLTEANYQQAATCTVCGAEVGEPLEAYFEEYGIECNVTETGMMYDFKGTAYKDFTQIINGKCVFWSDEELEPATGLEELDGYEWKRVWVDVIFPESEPKSGLQFFWLASNYYTEDSDNIRKPSYGVDCPFSVNWYGKDYNECIERFEVIQNLKYYDDDTFHSTVWSYILEYVVRVPIGYDGCVIGVYTDTPEKRDLRTNHPESANANTMFDEDSLVYRMK